MTRLPILASPSPPLWLWRRRWWAWVRRRPRRCRRQRSCTRRRPKSSATICSPSTTRPSSTPPWSRSPRFSSPRWRRSRSCARRIRRWWTRRTCARGEAMQAASEAAESGMVSVIGLDSEKVGKLCEAASEASGEKIAIANYLCAGNYACSGAMPAVEKVMEMAKPDFSARMAVKLSVAGAFHTDFMAPAVSKLEELLKEVTVSKPRIPVISNVDAKAHSDPEVIKSILTKQVTAPVQWETSMNNVIAAGYEAGYELGPGAVLP